MDIKYDYYFSKKIILYYLFLFLILLLTFHFYISEKSNFVEYKTDHNSIFFKIQDYAYHIIITKSFWCDGFGDFYSLEFQKMALKNYLKTPINFSMAPGVTPVSLIIWAPFAYISKYSMSLSYTSWIIFSILILFSGFLLIIHDSYIGKQKTKLLLYLVLITLFSPAFLGSLLLGQTSIFASGMFAHLIRIIYSRKNDKINQLISVLIVFLLGIKPVYSIIAFGILLIHKCWKIIIYSILVTSLFLILITNYLTINWIQSYLKILQMYSSGEFPENYRWAVVPSTMNIFRSAFMDIIGDAYSNLISRIVTFLTYFFTVGFSTINAVSNTKVKETKVKVNKEQAIVVLLGGYLLFAPYANAYEDFLFSIFLMVGFSSKRLYGINILNSIILIIGFTVCLAQSRFIDRNFLWILWLIKAVIVSFLFYIFRSKLEKNVSETIKKVELVETIGG